MWSNHSNEGFEAIVVGAPRGGRRREVTFLLGRLGVGYVLCDAIYAAVVELGRMPTDRRVVVISGLGEMSREGMRFLDICRSRENIRCCCFAGVNCRRGDERVLRARRSGALVISDMEELEAMLELLARDFGACCLFPRRLVAAESVLRGGFVSTRQEALLSRAEVDALFGDV